MRRLLLIGILLASITASAQQYNPTSSILGSYGIAGTMRYIANQFSIGTQFNQWKANLSYYNGMNDYNNRVGGEILYSIMKEESNVIDIFAGMQYFRDIRSPYDGGGLKIETDLYFNEFTNVGLSFGVGTEILIIEMKWIIRIN